jgi:diacylglycerol kinase (CTP)
MRKLKSKRDIHWERKITHVFGILLISAVYYFLPMAVTWFLFFTVALPFMVLDILRFKSEYLMNLSQKLFGSIMRDQETQRLSGTSFLFLGLAISMLFFPKKIALLAFLFLALADPIASIIGIKYGKTKLGPHKTILGSLAALVTCISVSIIYFNIWPFTFEKPFYFVIFAGLIGSFSEALAFKWLDDNFTQPVLNSLLLYGLFYLLGSNELLNYGAI